MNARERAERARAMLLSPSFDEARRRGWERSLETRAQAPKCGAKSRVTGDPCRQPVKEEGKRCRYHGGATPRGRDWHRRQLPRKGQSEAGYAGKLRALERRDREAEERRAAMTPEEREAHEQRRKAKRPGTPARRSMAARGRQMTEELAALLDRKDGPSAEVQRLEAAIRKLEEQRRRRGEAAAPHDDDGDTSEGIFG